LYDGCVCLFSIYIFFSGEEDSKTSAKEDLKSYEEGTSTAPNTQLVPCSLEPLRTSDMLKKGRIQLVCNVDMQQCLFVLLEFVHVNNTGNS
jgi:hypothetical protein